MMTATNRLSICDAKQHLSCPKELQNSMKGLINPQNEKDEECFRWCHLFKKFKAPKNSGRISQYRNYINRLNYDGVEFPVKQKHYRKIEIQNQIAINVFGYERVKGFRCI